MVCLGRRRPDRTLEGPPCRSCVRALVLALGVLAAWPRAQTIVRFGDPVRSGTITQPNQTHRFFLLGARAGDVLRATFASRRLGYGSYAHGMALLLGTKRIGRINGRGVLTVKLPSTTTYTIAVRALDATSTGWYGLRVDRLNDPVSAQRTALGWNMRGDISRMADFAMFTVRGEQKAKAVLRFSSRRLGYGSYAHYSEVLDDQGNRLAAVSNKGTSSAFSFPRSGIYTLFVAANGMSNQGWFAATVDCQSHPAIPCDTTPYVGNYGKGWRGTKGVPTLTAAGPPRIGSPLHIDLGNSYGKRTTAVLLVGVDAARQQVPGFGGTVLVSPAAHFILQLGPGRTRWSVPVPRAELLYGVGFGMQSLVRDPGAKPAGWAFSPGLLLVPGK